MDVLRGDPNGVFSRLTNRPRNRTMLDELPLPASLIALWCPANFTSGGGVYTIVPLCRGDGFRDSDAIGRFGHGSSAFLFERR